MTLVAAWTRRTRSGRELWVMSDSRLSGGKTWDYGPKIFGIGRSDALIAFAGDTAWTYPLIAQITSYVESFVNLRDRAIDFVEAQDQILNMLNESLSFVSDTAANSEKIPECSFILAGYSARRGTFIISKIYFHVSRYRFEFRSAKRIGEELFSSIGDQEAVSDISSQISRIERKYKNSEFQLDMVPSEVFFEIISSGRYRGVGGAPQLSKIYQRMSQRHFGVYWPPDLAVEEQFIFLRGRRLGKFEVLDHPWVFEPVSGRFYWQDFSPDNLRAIGEADRENA